MIKKKPAEKYYFKIFPIHITSHIYRYVYVTKGGQTSRIPKTCPVLPKNSPRTLKCPVLKTKTKIYKNYRKHFLTRVRNLLPNRQIKRDFSGLLTDHIEKYFKLLMELDCVR